MQKITEQEYLAFFPGQGLYWMPHWGKVVEVYTAQEARGLLSAAYQYVQHKKIPPELNDGAKEKVLQLAAFLKKKGARYSPQRPVIENFPSLKFGKTRSSGTRSFVNRKEVNWSTIENTLKDRGFKLRKREFLDNDFDSLCPVYYLVSEERGVISEGKGLTDEQARRSALAEGVERIFGVAPTSQKNLRLDTYKNLYRDKDWDLGTIVGPRDTFDKNSITEWLPATNISRNEKCYVPAEISYFGYSPQRTKTRLFSLYHTTGLACGSSIEEAALNGIFEILERDAYWITMRCKLNTADIDLKKVPSLDQNILKIVTALNKKGVLLHVKDMSLDWGVPIVHAVLEDTSGRLPAFTHGTGAGFTWSTAVARAVCEVLQMYVGQCAVVQERGNWQEIGAVSGASAQPVLMWSDPLYKNNLLHLTTPLDKKWRPRETISSVEELLAHLKNKGHEVLVTELASRGDLKVVRVLVTNVTQPDPRLERISPRLEKWRKKEGLRGFFTDSILT